MEDELKLLCKRMRLAYVYDYIMESKDKESLYPIILETLKVEQHERERSKATRLIHKAGFRTHKRLDQYEWRDSIGFPHSISKDELINLDFIHHRENLVFVGSPGTGKTTLATALGMEACMAGKDVQFYRVLDLVDKLQKASQRGTLARTRKSI